MIPIVSKRFSEIKLCKNNFRWRIKYWNVKLKNQRIKTGRNSGPSSGFIYLHLLFENLGIIFLSLDLFYSWENYIHERSWKHTIISAGSSIQLELTQTYNSSEMAAITSECNTRESAIIIHHEKSLQENNHTNNFKERKEKNSSRNSGPSSGCFYFYFSFNLFYLNYFLSTYFIHCANILAVLCVGYISQLYSLATLFLLNVLLTLFMMLLITSYFSWQSLTLSFISPILF